MLLGWYALSNDVLAPVLHTSSTLPPARLSRATRFAPDPPVSLGPVETGTGRLVGRGVACALVGALVGLVGTVAHRAHLLGVDLPGGAGLGIVLALLTVLAAATLARAWGGMAGLLGFGVGWVVVVQLLSLEGRGRRARAERARRVRLDLRRHARGRRGGLPAPVVVQRPPGPHGPARASHQARRTRRTPRVPLVFAVRIPAHPSSSRGPPRAFRHGDSGWVSRPTETPISTPLRTPCRSPPRRSSPRLPRRRPAPTRRLPTLPVTSSTTPTDGPVDTVPDASAPIAPVDPGPAGVEPVEPGPAAEDPGATPTDDVPAPAEPQGTATDAATAGATGTAATTGDAPAVDDPPSTPPRRAPRPRPSPRPTRTRVPEPTRRHPPLRPTRPPTLTR